MQEAQELGLTVNSWTVNKVEDMKWLLEQGADFITTDEPALLLELIQSK
ncbi:glycerophosphodiester phosphodiesterase family protein [Algoriphagus halophilus]